MQVNVLRIIVKMTGMHVALVHCYFSIHIVDHFHLELLIR